MVGPQRACTSAQKQRRLGKACSVGGEVALGHLAACDLVLYWPDGWVWQGWTKSGRHATPVRLQKDQHQGTSSNIPRPCDTRFDGGVRSAAGIFLDTAVQPAASFRSVVSAHLPPTRD